MEVAALSPGVGVTEAPETTMPGKPDRSPREVAQPWWQQWGLGYEQREGCHHSRAQVFLFCSLLSHPAGTRASCTGQVTSPKELTLASCSWCGAESVLLGLCPVVSVCVLPQPESGWQLWLSELGRVLQRQL